MMNGFTIGGTHTSELGFCIAGKSLSAPKKKEARVTIPFMNGSYDFSKVYGRSFFEDRELGYTFDLIADNPTDLESQITRLTEFVAYVHEEDIYDDDILQFHYHGSYSDMDIDRDDTGLSAQVEVQFKIYPFRIANEVHSERVEEGTTVITNDGYPTRITVVPDTTMTIQVGSLNQTFNSKTISDMLLETGDNRVVVANGGGYIEWNEERI